MTPFAPSDSRELIVDASAVVARYFPDYCKLYEERGWTMFDAIDRVYDVSKAARTPGFVCKTVFPRSAGQPSLTGQEGPPCGCVRLWCTAR
jgi:UDP-glucose 4-epimerase